MATALGLNRLRINVFPILLSPFGLTSILTPPLPLPAAITVEFLPALDWSGRGPEPRMTPPSWTAATPRSRGSCNPPSTA